MARTPWNGLKAVPYSFLTAILCVGAVQLNAQSTASIKLGVLQAEERGAASTRDVLTIRNAARSRDIDTVRMAVRALGRLERPSLIPDILFSLRNSLPEIRVEAANAIAQAAQGFKNAKNSPAAASIQSTQADLIARLEVEAEASVRAALCEAIARLPYKSPGDVERAENQIVGLATRQPTSTTDRLGVVKGLEALLRIHKSVRPAGMPAIALLKTFVRQAESRPGAELLRDARVRRLAFEGLTSASALDDEMVGIGAADPDAQVRRLAMRGAAISGAGMANVIDGLHDPIALVRLEALRAVRSRADERACTASVNAMADPDMTVALVATDQLGACGSSPDAVAVLERTVADRSALAMPRGWHRNAHAIVALATAAKDRARDELEPYKGSGFWQVRVYAARAAVIIGDRVTLDVLAKDSEDRVANVALAGLGQAPRPAKPRQPPSDGAITADNLRRLASPQAVVTIRDVGRFDLALFTTEAPATVLRFAELAESGYYDGLTFDRIAPNAIVQGGHRGSDEAQFLHPEAGTWPHVRYTVGISAPDTGDAQFFVNLVDNPRLDHDYTVFAQILNGGDIVDQILEGDVIESIVIVP